MGDNRGTVVYTYDNATGRLKREDYPNGSYVEYTYYGADNPSQVGFVWKVEHKKADGTLLIGYEYTYDLLGRVVQSVERPSGDTTVYTYTPAGRLESEQRTGQVAYSRVYEYNLDGSRRSVYRNDALNGAHHDFYEYDLVSGRLRAVEDRVSGVPPYPRHEFVWNTEGTLARWDDPLVAYDRVFSYDEEGRLVRIERDYGDGSLQVAYEYGYNSDGVRVWKQDMLAQQEYRYICRIGCGSVPMRVYSRAMGATNWNTQEEYLDAPTVRWCGTGLGSFIDYPLLAGRWLSFLAFEGQEMLYHDAFQIRVAGSTLFGFDDEFGDYPEVYLGSVNLLLYSPFAEGFSDYRFAYLYSVDPSRTWIITLACAVACVGAGVSIGLAWDRCKQTPIDQGGCKGLQGFGWWQCMINCAVDKGCIGGAVSIVLCVGCLLCICSIAKVRPLCNKVIDQVKKIKKIWSSTGPQQDLFIKVVFSDPTGYLGLGKENFVCPLKKGIFEHPLAGGYHSSTG
ncbi:hypothetical protein HRbin15_00745 [bacterium HR15]|nr:hypothetical protein HRbin15_00745 [bacterium HR15]